MNKLTIIGNLTRDPELRTTTTGKRVCSFSVAVNRWKSAQQRQDNQDPGADFFNVSAWEERGEVCAKYLAKGRKVCVVGPVSVRVFTRDDGTAGASLEVKAEEVEFLSSRQDGDGGDQNYGSGTDTRSTNPHSAQQQEPQQVSLDQVDAQSGYQKVEMDSELPF